MAATKKNKKGSKAKKTPKTKKKNKKQSLNMFSRIMLILLIIAVVISSVAVVVRNVRENDKESETVITEITPPSNQIANKDNIFKKDNDSKVKENKGSETVIINDSSFVEDKPEPKKEQTEVKAEEKKTEAVKNNVTEAKKAEEKSVAETENINLKKTFKEEQKINGCWLSSSQGASLTLDQYGYRIDFFGVDASEPLTGKYTVDKNQIIFTDGSKIEGVYRINFDDKNIDLVCKDDKSKQRKNILETEWEWIEY